MPTVMRNGPYRFYFYSHEPNEPPHVHIDRDRFSAKFWIESVEVSSNIDFRTQELRKLKKLVVKHQGELLEAWHDYFSGHSR